MTGLFIGLNTVDLQFVVDKFPLSNTKKKAAKNGIYTGGPATNASVIYSCLGGNAFLYTSIGEHHLMDFILKEIKSYGVNVLDCSSGTQTEPTLASIITEEENGNRTIFSYLPEDPKNDHADVMAIKELRPNIILVDGFYPEMTTKILLNCSNQVPVVLDGGSWKPGMENILPMVNIAICSDHFIPPGINSRDEMVAYLQSEGISKIAITRGENSILIWEGKRHYSIPVKKIKVLDTLGAGDFFHGAFCYYFSSGNPFTESLKLASGIATQSCQHIGTRSWLNSLIF